MAAKKEVEKEASSPGLFSATSGPGRDERRRKSNANRKPWPRGVSGNPAGKNGWSERNDLAAEIARAIFEQDGEAIFAAFRKVLRKGSPYAYQVLSDRAYGKMKETIAHEHGPYKEVSTPDLEAHVRELEAKLIANLVERGYTITKPPQLLPPADDSKVQ